MWLYFWGQQKDHQKFGKNPITVRDSDHYIHEYTPEFVDRWDSLIDQRQRSDREHLFLSQILQANRAYSVLDAATGTGFDSIALARSGFQVVSVDGSRMMLNKARQNARQNHVELQTVACDWRRLTQKVTTFFDAVICTGNSFSHLFSIEDRRRALVEFYQVLKPGGVLLIDLLNYDELLAGKQFTPPNYYYTAQACKIDLTFIDSGLARFCYRFAQNATFFLNLFPLRRKEFVEMVSRAGFRFVSIYPDLKEAQNHQQPESHLFAITK